MTIIVFFYKRQKNIFKIITLSFYFHKRGDMQSIHRIVWGIIVWEGQRDFVVQDRKKILKLRYFKSFGEDIRGIDELV